MKEFFEPIVIIIFLILFSILGRVILEKIGQKWITTFAHTTTLILLPVITFMITKVISGNIALSLGMVGALSIVRFRTPIKEPEELNYLFFSIAIGLAIGADQYLVALFGVGFMSLYIILRFKGSRYSSVSKLGSFTSIIRLPLIINFEHGKKGDLDIFYKYLNVM